MFPRLTSLFFIASLLAHLVSSDRAFAQASGRPSPSVAVSTRAHPAPLPTAPSLVLHGPSEHPRCAEGVHGCFLDQSGAWRSHDAAYLDLLDVEPHYGVAALEAILVVGVGAIWYFAAIEENKLDWDIESLRQRFSRESVRYDNNTFRMNFLLHPLSGAAYYSFPRSNGLNLGAAFAYSVFSSMLWEFGLEFNERLSINDIVTTSIGGMPIGEFIFRLGRYLNSAPGGGNAMQRAFGYTLGVEQAFVDRALDGRHGAPRATVTDALGYDADIAHRFSIDMGFGVGRTDLDDAFFRYDVRVSGDLVALPGYMRAGAFNRAFADANFTHLAVRGVGGARGRGTALYADTILAGYFAQDIRVTDRGLRGFAVAVGSSVGYTHRRERHGTFRDKLGITHLPGLAVEANVLLGRYGVALRGRLHGDFAGVHAMAFDQWDAANPDVPTKTVLERERFYYGWGYSARAELEVTLPYVRAGVNAYYGQYHSDEGLDRAQETIDDGGIDVRASDRVIDAEAFVRLSPFRRRPAYVELTASRQRRLSRVAEFETSRRFEQLSLRLGTVF